MQLVRTVDHNKMQTRGEEIQNSENFADVLYVWSLLTHLATALLLPLGLVPVEMHFFYLILL